MQGNRDRVACENGFVDSLNLEIAGSVLPSVGMPLYVVLD